MLTAPKRLSCDNAGVMRIFADLLRDRKGATAIEYCLIAMIISLAAILAFQSIGLSLTGIIEAATNGMRA